MPIRKPVVKVWCLPALPEEALNRLQTDIVFAAVSVKSLTLRMKDLLVLFPTDMMQSLGTEILIEYDDVAERWKREGDGLDQLAAKLGNVVKRHFPTAFIQCQVNRGPEKKHFWTSEQGVNRREVEQVHLAVTELLPSFRKIADVECYCEENSIDFKGACHHHNILAYYEHAVKQGALVLGTGDPEEFQALADVYVADCRGPTYTELHYKLGWVKRPSSRPAIAVA